MDIALAVIGTKPLLKRNVENVSFYSDDYIALGQKLVDDLSLEADYIIVLGNITPSSGFSAVDIANTIKGIDLIIDGKYGVEKTRVGDYSYRQCRGKSSPQLVLLS